MALPNIIGFAEHNLREVLPQLQSLIDLATKVWQSNLQIMKILVKLQTSGPSPDLRYTWVQEPVKFEDAMGRVIPVPSEYNWGVSRRHANFGRALTCHLEIRSYYSCPVLHRVWEP